MDRLRNLRFTVPGLLFFCAAIVEVPLGFIVDLSWVPVLLYAGYLVHLFKMHPCIGINYIWYIIMSVLMVLGVYSCDSSGLFLSEIGVQSHYSNATSSIVLMSVLFFSTLCVAGRGENSHAEVRRPSLLQPYGQLASSVLLIVAIIAESLIFASIFSHPYFDLGVNRFDYANAQMGAMSSTVKNWLPVFIPCAIVCFKNGKKIMPVLYFVLLFLIYFWTGEKFGGFFFAVSVLIVCIGGKEIARSKRTIIKVLLAFVALAAGVLLVGVFQHVVLYNAGLDEYIQYLTRRLAQQGECWWAVFEKINESGARLGELSESLVASLTEEDARSLPYAGQWKMMLVASDYSAYTLGRVAIGVPYTSTTQATLFYYFSWAGIVAIPLLALLCRSIVEGIVSSVSASDCVMAMLLVKVLMSFNSLYTSSSISAFTTPAVLCVLVLLMLFSAKSHSKKYPRKSLATGDEGSR